MYNTHRCLVAAMLILAMLATLPCLSFAQVQTVGLTAYNSGTSGGYTLFGPIGSTETFLIDIYGRLVHSWPSSARPNLSVYLLDNGDLLRTTKPGGVQRLAWDGTVLW